MFHSAAVRLTLWYLAIIMCISLVFSGLLYQVSSDDLHRNVNRQIGYFNNFLAPDDFDNYTRLRIRQLTQDIGHLRANLLIFNLLVLAGGGGASYWLARRTLEPIEEALRAQSRFAADASHELRTPLTAIQTENEVALRNPNLKKTEAKALLKSNLEEVAKLRSLSESLLRLANSSGRLEDARPTPLQPVIKEAVAKLSKTAKSKQIRINDKTAELTVMGDSTGLSELFSIFIDNAIKYSPPKSTINIGALKHHKDVRVTITDNGAGISKADLPKIFERFYQADASRSKQGRSGYGLGLAIAKRITEAHGGHIEVKSTEGKGSSFIVHLPSA